MGDVIIDNKLFWINALLCVFDTVVGLAAIAAFAWAANRFGYWWLLIFALLPMSMYFNHGVITLTKEGEEDDGRKTD